MTKFKLLAKLSGVGKDSGKAWYRIFLRSTEGVIKDFFISEKVWTIMAKDAIEIDDEVLITCELDANMHFAITIIEKAG